MSFQIHTQESKRFAGHGYWQVNAGPIILVGRPCRDITRAKARAKHYVESGKAQARLTELRQAWSLEEINNEIKP
jgi:anthranilate phosphoribosyltransferase